MLLQLRFLCSPVQRRRSGQRGLRGQAGARSARAYVYGWAYQTLEGHFEQGEMHYQVWKWLDSGDVEFRLHAVSKVAETGPWVLRSRLPARRAVPKQLRFYRQTCRRVRRLTEAELETERVAKAA